MITSNYKRPFSQHFAGQQQLFGLKNDGTFFKKKMTNISEGSERCCYLPIDLTSLIFRFCSDGAIGNNDKSSSFVIKLPLLSDDCKKVFEQSPKKHLSVSESALLCLVGPKFVGFLSL